MVLCKTRVIDKTLLFLSTHNFLSREIKDIVKICRDIGIYSLELGAGFVYKRELLPEIKKESSGFNFLVHNYFPPPQKSFVLNLGSLDNNILDLSIKHCKNAINLARKLGAPFYSVHSAFCFRALPSFFKGNYRRLKFFPKEETYNKFLETVVHLNLYAKSKGLRFVIENNSVPHSGLRNGENIIALMAEADELLKIVKDVNSDNFKLLVDLGHLKVTANTLRFDKVKFIKKIAPHIVALHLSDNDGVSDQHLSFSKKTWFMPLLKEFKNKHIIIECESLTTKELLKCRDIVLKALQ